MMTDRTPGHVHEIRRVGRTFAGSRRSTPSFDDWTRVRYQIGPGVMVSDRFRVEVYYARQDDDVPLETSPNALGAVAKFYF